MQAPVLQPHNLSVVEVDARVSACIVEGCGGAVVRHSLGGGQSIDRCTRCFRRYQLKPGVQSHGPGAFRRFLNDFVTWRDD